MFHVKPTLQMTPDSNFKSLSYNHDNSTNTQHDPHLKLYPRISSFKTHHCTPNDFKNNFLVSLKTLLQATVKTKLIEINRFELNSSHPDCGRREKINLN